MHQNLLRQKHKREGFLTRPQDPLLPCDTDLKQSSACMQKCGWGLCFFQDSRIPAVTGEHGINNLLAFVVSCRSDI